MDAILLIIGIVYGACRIIIKSVQQCTDFLFSVNLLLVGVNLLGNVIILVYTDETVLVLNNPTLLKTLWRPLDVCSWLVYFGDGMSSP
jgi:hypothetical protein